MRRRRVKESRYKTVTYQCPGQSQDAAATLIQAAYRANQARREPEMIRRLQHHRGTRTSRVAAPARSAAAAAVPFPPYDCDTNQYRVVSTSPRGHRRHSHFVSHGGKYPLSSSGSSSSSCSQNQWADKTSRHGRARSQRYDPRQMILTHDKVPHSRAVVNAEEHIRSAENDGGIRTKERKAWFLHRSSSPESYGSEGYFCEGREALKMPRAYGAQRPTSDDWRAAYPRIESCEANRTKTDVFSYLFEDRPVMHKRSWEFTKDESARRQTYAARLVHTAHERSRGHESSYTVQRSSKESLLSRDVKSCIRSFNDADRRYQERRIARRLQRKETSDDEPRESCTESDAQGSLAEAAYLPEDPSQTEKWVLCQNFLAAEQEPLRAESAADPSLIFGHAASLPVASCPLKSTQRHTVEHVPGASVDGSSEDTSPPLERKHLRFVSRTHSPEQGARRSYKDIIREEETKKATTAYTNAYRRRLGVYKPTPRAFYIPSFSDEDDKCAPLASGFEKTTDHRISEKNARRTEVDREDCGDPAADTVELVTRRTCESRGRLAQAGRDECIAPSSECVETVDRRISEKSGMLTEVGRDQCRAPESDLTERMDRHISENKEWRTEVGRNKSRYPAADFMEVMDHRISEKRGRRTEVFPNASGFEKTTDHRISEKNARRTKVVREDCGAPAADTVELVTRRTCESRGRLAQAGRDECIAPSPEFVETVDRRISEKSGMLTEVGRDQCRAPESDLTERMDSHISENKEWRTEVGRDKSRYPAADFVEVMDHRISEKRGRRTEVFPNERRSSVIDIVGTKDHHMSEKRGRRTEVGRAPELDYVTMERRVSENRQWRTEEGSGDCRPRHADFVETVDHRTSEKRGRRTEVFRDKYRASARDFADIMNHRMSEKRGRRTEVDHGESSAPGPNFVETMNCSVVENRRPRTELGRHQWNAPACKSAETMDRRISENRGRRTEVGRDESRDPAIDIVGTVDHRMIEKRGRHAGLSRDDRTALGADLLDTVDRRISEKKGRLTGMSHHECGDPENHFVRTMDRRVKENSGRRTGVGRDQCGAPADDFAEAMGRRIIENRGRRAEDGREETAERMNALCRTQKKLAWDDVRTRRQSFPRNEAPHRERTITQSSWPLMGEREIGSIRMRAEKWSAIACNGSGDRAPTSADIRVLQSASFGPRNSTPRSGKWEVNATQWEDAADEGKKTQSFTCRSSLRRQAASEQSHALGGDPVYWSPLSKLLPPMTPRTVNERNTILGSFFDDSFYDSLSTRPHPIVNTQCHNLMSIGGISPAQPTDYVDGAALLLYDLLCNEWRSYGFMPEPRCYHTAVVVGNKDIIVAGGLDPLCVTSSGHMQASSKAFFFNSKRRKWSEIPSMNSERAFHAAVGWHDRAIVCGGIDRTGRTLSSAEVYYLSGNQWTLIHPMPTGLMGMAAATVDSLVYIVGGISRGPDGDALQDSIYAFDPRRDTWTALPPMAQKKAFCSSLPVQRDLWVVGGVVQLQPEVKCTSRIDVFRLASSTVERRSDLPTPMHSVRVAKTSYKIYLLGGQDEGNRPCDDAVVIDRIHHTLVECCPLPRSLAGAASVVVPGSRSLMLLRRRRLPAKNATAQKREESATVIQQAFRKYRRGESLQPELKKGRPRPVRRVDEEPLFLREQPHALSTPPEPVHIETWPPSARSDAELESICGASGSEAAAHHQHTLPENMDPNVGMVGRLDGSFLQTKSSLGLRAAPEWQPVGLRELQRTLQPCDPHFPVILLVGGLDPRNPLSSGSAVLKYHPFKDRWMLAGAMPEPRNYHAAAYVNDKLFVTGGYSPLIRKNGEMVATKTTFTMNVKTGTWERQPDMLAQRACHASVATGGKILVFGGRGHHGRLLDSAEEFNVDNNKWRQLSPMPEPRMGMAIVVKEGYIWLMGGMSERSGDPVVPDVLLYSLKDDRWTLGGPLRLPRAFASAALINGCIWLYGGCMTTNFEGKHPVSMNSLDVCSKHSEWKKVCNLKAPRHSAAAATIGSCIYLLGGINSYQLGVLSKNTLLVTDRNVMLSPSEMPEPIAGHSAVTVLPSTSQHSSSSVKWSDAIFERLT